MSVSGLGWKPHLEPIVRAAWADQGQPPIYRATVFAADTRPLPPAFSLSNLVITWMDQGPVGTCYCNAGTQAIEVAAGAAAVAGEGVEQVRLSRAYVAWEACKRDFESDPRNRGRRLAIDVTQGATITGVMRALDESGACREELFPYKPDSRHLNRPPTPEMVEQAKVCQLTGVMDIELKDFDARKRSIFNGHPPVVGIWWPGAGGGRGWDQGYIDQYGRTSGVSGGGFGHALTIIGWVDPGVWDGHLYWQYVNSHGAIYPVPSPEMRAKVPGYRSARPDRCYTFWVRDDHERMVFNKGMTELIAPAGVTGFRVRSLPTWDSAMA